MRIGLIQALLEILPSGRFAAGSSAIKDGLMAAVLSARCRSPSPANASGVCFTAQPHRGEPELLNELMTRDTGVPRRVAMCGMGDPLELQAFDGVAYGGVASCTTR